MKYLAITALAILFACSPIKDEPTRHNDDDKRCRATGLYDLPEC